MNTKYDVTLRVDSRKLPLILEVVNREAELVRVVVGADDGHAAPEKKMRYANGTKAKGVTGLDLMVQILGSEKRAFTREEIVAEFEKRGFSANSASPVMSKLLADKRATRDGNMFKLAPVVVPLRSRPEREG